MSFYLLLYLLVSINLFVTGLLYYFNNKNRIDSYFFITSIFFLFLWINIYFMFYFIGAGKEVLLLMSRSMYSLALFCMYSMLLFVFYYNKKTFSKSVLFLIVISLGGILSIGILTPVLVETMRYNEDKKIYYEVYGLGYNLYFLLYSLLPPIFGISLYLKLKTISSKIKKNRLKIIGLGFLMFISLGIIFLGLLPLFNIRTLDKEQIMFFIPFIVAIWYSTYKYNFLDIKVLLGKILNFIFSLFISILIISFLREYLLNILDKNLNGFWQINQFFGIFDLTLGILIFTISQYLFKKYVIGQSEYYYLSKELNKIKRKIAFISSFYELNIILNSELTKLFKTNYISIELYNKEKPYLEGLKNYFLRDKSYKLFINDVVFIEENKNKYNYEKIKDELDEKSYLIFGLINNKREFIGVFKLGSKLFQDGYTQEEIDIILDFVDFLIGHLKYLEMYLNIQELNVNLDKKIDEKTIEYNILLNKQNDFIAMASHEIKSPLGSCIFQLDYLIEELKDGGIKGKKVIEELEILNKQLIKVGDLTKKIFSAQKYELGKIELYIQPIEINYLLEDKIELYKKLNPKINFIKEIVPDIGNVNIDKIQFEQVIDNLITNAIKFSNTGNPEILIKAFIENYFLIIEVEDNGEGFNGIELESIFDKYTTGGSSVVGLGMGMFLCKKIIELHGGNISAEIGEKLKGAKFTINLPIES